MSLSSKKYSIQNLDEYWTNNISSDIVIISQHTSEIYSYSQHSVLNLKYYCQKQRYRLIIFNQHLCPQVHPCWYKIILLIHLLPKYKFLIWIDSDVIITNPQVRFERFIDQSNDIFVCQDISPQRTPFNSGVMIIKNNRVTQEYLQQVWNYNGPHGYTPHGDQDILNKIFLKKKTSGLKIKIYPINYFNSHPRVFKHQDFILHLMVRDTQKRSQIMRQFNKYLKITNDNIPLECIFNKKCLGEHKINCSCQTCQGI